MSIKPMTRREQISNALPGEERVRRKFDGKYYTLMFAEYSQRRAEEIARIWRSNDTGNPHFVRIVHVPRGGRIEYEKWLLYMRPRPLTPAERDEERQMKARPNLADLFFGGQPKVPKIVQRGGKNRR
jgi:hypothetical protein